MRIPEPVNIMTASIVPGDAIGNYILTLKRLIEQEGKEVRLFADHVAPQYGDIARLSQYYRPGAGTLWYHYSIYADNLEQIQRPADFKIVDYHGVSPPGLLQKYDPHLAHLCQQGVDELPNYNKAFDISIVHSEYTRGELQRLGFRDVHKLPLVVDTSRFWLGGCQTIRASPAALLFLVCRAYGAAKGYTGDDRDLRQFPSTSARDGADTCGRTSFGSVLSTRDWSYDQSSSVGRARAVHRADQRC